MSMELLAAPYLEEPHGYYHADDARRAQIEHLEDVLLSLAHIASVDAFQSWIYTSGKGADALDRRPQLAAALAAGRRGKCPVIVAKLDRLSRDVAFIAGLLAQRLSAGA